MNKKRSNYPSTIRYSFSKKITKTKWICDESMEAVSRNVANQKEGGGSLAQSMIHDRFPY